MKIDLSQDELLVTLASLNYHENRYKHGAVPLEYLRNTNQDLAKAVDKALDDIRGVIKKIEPIIGNGGKFVFLYVPNGIRDKKLEKELGKRIPKCFDPEKDNFFWSNKFNNYVVSEKYVEQIIDSAQARYGDNAEIERNPEWASKSNTWQIITKEQVGRG